MSQIEIEVEAHKLHYGDRFYYCGLLWQHCGWYSAVYHICGFCLQTGEKRVIAHVAKVIPFEEQYLDGLGI